MAVTASEIMTSGCLRATIASDDWLPPVAADSLNTIGDDIPRPPGRDSQEMPISYRFSSSDDYQIYMATQAVSVPGWTTPTLLSWVDTANLDVDGFESNDGLLFAFRLTGSMALASRICFSHCDRMHPLRSELPWH